MPSPGQSTKRLRCRPRAIVAIMLVLVAGCTPSHTRSRATSSGASPAVGLARFPEPGTGRLPSGQTAALQAVLDQVVAEYNQLRRHGFPATHEAVPGITAAVVGNNGTWMGAAGRSGDSTPLTPHSMMAIGSITKTFTAAEVLHLAEVGKLNLDAQLSRYLPGRWTASRCTVRQALSMRSGLPADDAHADALLLTLRHRHHHITPEQSARTLVSDRPSRPGGAPAYSNAVFLLLGLLIEHVTQQPFAAAVRADLIRPAGLDRIAVQDAERPVPPLAYPPERNGGHNDGYLPSQAGASVAFSAGGIAADAPTIARWGYQLYGARVLSASTVQSMIGQPTQSDVFPGVGYGLGTMIFHNLQFTINDSVGHGGGVPGYVSLLVVVPERHLSIALLINDDGKDAFNIMGKLFLALR
ncbi:MAG: D-alanyl-D-alanine carboxypeptidase [Pseudonocardiales bacterium]|nr:D-alanyl-D-alanine carboxypeptidase [Pseudonocardiales bacterium]